VNLSSRVSAKVLGLAISTVIDLWPIAVSGADVVGVLAIP
jgi:hypothetical protein